MRLSDLLARDEALALAPASAAATGARAAVHGVTADSRRLRPGWLFAALPGAHDDGRQHIAAALAAGAVAVLVPADTPVEALPLDAAAVPVLLSQTPRASLARACAALTPGQPPRVAGITGTNGKSSTVAFARQIAARLGRPAASLGTLGLVMDGVAAPSAARVRDPGKLTTAEPEMLHPCLADLAQAGVDSVFLEASSHGLVQGRLDGVALATGAFLNISHDHLDYHRDAAAYFDAKARLFRSVLPRGAPAVINSDDPAYPRLAEIAHERGQAVWDFGRTAKRVQVASVDPGRQELAVRLAVDGTAHDVRIPVAGTFQAFNAAAALALNLALGAPAREAVAALEHLQAPTGRLEAVATTPSGATVFVDYAHSPGGLEQMLQALRPHVSAALWALIGCGGDRDAGKRPLMGEIAARLADRVIVTDDNPRGESPAAIREQVRAGCPQAWDIGDRRAAIAAGVAELGAGDALVIAGKGHERDQEVAGEVRPFDDAAEAREAVAALQVEAGP